MAEFAVASSSSVDLISRALRASHSDPENAIETQRIAWYRILRCLHVVRISRAIRELLVSVSRESRSVWIFAPFEKRGFRLLILRPNILGLFGVNFQTRARLGKIPLFSPSVTSWYQRVGSKE